MADAALSPAPARSSRFWLYTPFAILVVVAIAWTAAWFMIRSEVGRRIGVALAREASMGRQWTCEDQRIAGYPFRIELSCRTLTLRRGALTASLGAVEAVAQVYQPRFVIVEVGGPLSATDGAVTVEGTWKLLETSVRATRDTLQRASLVVEAPSFTVTASGAEPVTLAGQHLEAHLRPNPAREAERALDGALEIRQARVPALDPLLGPEPAEIGIDLTATQAEEVRGRPWPEELERWRQAGGVLDILRLSVAKPGKRLEARGSLRLDDQHRIMGDLNASAAGLDQLVAALTGNRAGGNLLGALLGGRPPADPNGAPSLRPLPPVRFDNGRVALGPFALPGVRLLPLY